MTASTGSTNATDPRLNTQFIQSRLAIKARGLRRRLTHLCHERTELKERLSHLTQLCSELQSELYNTEVQLFEENSLIKKKQPKPTNNKQDNSIETTLQNMSKTERAELLKALAQSLTNKPA
jgi:hypothetical protein